ncbi:hypothetical protein BDL97_01G079200 [Sphagnum fallax]|nr:hypothetical protein BDL97_01G079200 [Sphagnum fallax]
MGRRSTSSTSVSLWEDWLEQALQALQSSMLLRSLRPLAPSEVVAVVAGRDCKSPRATGTYTPSFQTFQGLGTWDRAAVEVEVSHATFQCWNQESPSTGSEVCNLEDVLDVPSTGVVAVDSCNKLRLFSGNDYLGLSVHPAVRSAAAEAALEFGMGPRASALVCGYTYHHRLLESTIAELKSTEECLLCPSGFAANMAVMTAVTSLAPGTVKGQENVVAIFSDALNHASIIDGARVAQRQSNAEVYVYKHNDMAHLQLLLSKCTRERKVVVTDSLFSMDGDFALLVELVALRQQHGFLLVIDEAHGTLVCGENGGGVAEALGVQDEIDIHVGTLSKAVGCQGGFIASSQKWKQLIQSRGRSFIFSTALPIPIVAAAHAAILVAREEKWRQRAVWERVQQFSQATGLHFTSPIAPIILGSADDTLKASRQLLMAGFHVSAIRPPTVASNASRLRITLSAAHTTADVEALVVALSPWIRTTCSSPSYRQYAAQRFDLSLPKEISQTLPQNHMIGMPSQGRQGKHYTKAGILFIQPKL